MPHFKFTPANTFFKFLFVPSQGVKIKTNALFPLRSFQLVGIFGVLLFLICAPFAMAKSLKPETSPLPSLYRAPELVGLTHWINSQEIDSMQDLSGKVVLIDFWTYSCINCVHTLPYLKKWHNRFADEGLVILGVHAPEFQYERKPENVAEAVKKFGLTYPIALDNGFKLWRSYKNRYWPALYLIDHEGVVRFMHFGEGKYAETEAAIVELLSDARL